MIQCIANTIFKQEWMLSAEEELNDDEREDKDDDPDQEQEPNKKKRKKCGSKKCPSIRKIYYEFAKGLCSIEFY